MKKPLIFAVSGRKKGIKLSELAKRLKAVQNGRAEWPILYYTGSAGNKPEEGRVSERQYLSSPCGTLPLPYCLCGGSAKGAEHVAGEGITPPDTIPSGAYCRLSRRLGDMQRVTSDRYSVRQLFIGEDAEDMALCKTLAAQAGCEGRLEELIQKPYFKEKLCVAVHERATGACVCIGVACCDAAVGEAWIERVLPPSAEGEALKLLINELLRRMAPGSQFATACAPHDSALEHAMRKCGFTGGDMWVCNLREESRIE